MSRARWETLAELAQFRVKNLAGLCGCSMRHLQREFRRSFGCPPQAWLNGRRLLAARQRLVSGEPIKKIAADLGFRQLAHFYHQFKAANRMTPLEFATSQGGADAECRAPTKNVAAEQSAGIDAAPGDLKKLRRDFNPQTKEKL